MSYVLITGASTGIGEEFARQFAAAGRNLVLVARSTERLKALAQELSSKHSIVAQTLTQDLSELGAAEKVFRSCQASNWEVDILVNNAGFGMFGKLAENDAKGIHQMMMLNMVALTELSRLFLPSMLARKTGGILNVASTAAFQPIPTFAVYAATKAYVLSLSEALHHEVTGTGVKVMALCPGPTETQFFSNAEKASGKKGSIHAPMQSAREIVAPAIAKFLKGQRSYVPGILNRLTATLAPRAPKALTLTVAEKAIRSGSGMT